MKDTLILALPLVALIALLVIIACCERYTKRHRPNRRRAGWLPEPDHKAVAGNWWRDCPPVERR